MGMYDISSNRDMMFGMTPCCTLLYSTMSHLLHVQDLAVGMDLEGQKVKDPMRTLLPVLLPPKDRYTKHNKIRAVLLYIFSLNGVFV